MSFKREIWTNWYVRKPCPNCNLGTLNPFEKNFLRNETPYSVEMNSLGGYYMNNYIFSIHLKCNNPNCEEFVAVLGEVSVFDEKNDVTDEMKKIHSFSPKSFYPAPNIIQIPKACPKLFTKTLKESFSLYWMDLSSCANKIRLSIEVLMSYFGIPTIQQNSKKNNNFNISLHKRLEIFGNDYEEGKFKTVSDLLLSVKWIGNEGSHNPQIKRDDVLSAYELLDFSLEILFSEREKKILAVSEEVSNRLDPKKNLKINVV